MQRFALMHANPAQSHDRTCILYTVSPLLCQVQLPAVSTCVFIDLSAFYAIPNITWSGGIMFQLCLSRCPGVCPMRASWPWAGHRPATWTYASHSHRRPARCLCGQVHCCSNVDWPAIGRVHFCAKMEELAAAGALNDRGQCSAV